MVKAMLLEMEKRGNKDNGYLPGVPADTFYIGGGTPSVLPADDLRRIADKASEISGGSWREFTVEVNPEDITPDYLRALRDMGADRLSIGIQSFIDRDLRYMNRRHNAERAERSVMMAQDAGFSNITVDLMYGIPGMSLSDSEHNLENVFVLGVPHFSAYHLMIEPKTVFGIKQKNGIFNGVTEESSVRQYEMLEKMADGAGFDHYEVSNFAKDGFRAVHNSNYWQGIEYLGIGPSAHSYDGHGRYWNAANNTVYRKAWLENGGAGAGSGEELSLYDRYNEYVMIRLRTAEGVRVDELSRLFGETVKSYFLRETAGFIGSGKLCEKDGRVFIKTCDFLVSDDIISGLFYIND